MIDRMSLLRLLVVAGLGLIFASSSPAFNGHVVTAGPLTVTIGEIPVVRTREAVVACPVALANAGAGPLVVELELGGLADEWRPAGPARRTVTVPAGGKAGAEFALAISATGGGGRTYSALYPVHVFARFEAGGAAQMAQAIRIFETDFGPAGSAGAGDSDEEPPAVRVPDRGALPLTAVRSVRVAWAYAGGAEERLPAGWTGSHAASGTSFHRGPIARGGETRATLQLHPPYRPRAGTASVEYRLQLPATTPLRLDFAHAIRDSTPREGTSDGVTFRVWVDDERVFERHTATKTWLPGEVDLGAWARRTIRLRLESHPGPKLNTVCDASYWGDPVVTAGPPPRVATPAERETALARVRALLRGGAGAAAAADEFVADLAGGLRAAVVPGPNGLADGAIGFGSEAGDVRFGGLHLAVEERVLGAGPAGAAVERVEAGRDAAGRMQFRHHLALDGRRAVLTATVWAEGPALRVKVECPEFITGLALNAADQVAPRVYYGHGYCITDPEPFRAGSGGHNLASSHVGFEFAGGVSLLVATDTPPDHLQVDPGRRLYQLHTHPDATLTFVPGRAGAFDCAIRYRPLSEKRAAPAVARKAGRFVFDLWGGRYADNTAKLARAFDYGLTDALVILHNWQRWGYDYRLPDIFPPNPALGTPADVQELGRLCGVRGVPWALHDNYIDLYPDATGFTYDDVTFHADGRPRRAWFNQGRQAQSFQFRPDRFQPYLQRNLAAIVPALRPTASFVDVFASLQVFDFHDRDGRRHSRLETQRAWGEAFAAIREACGGDAPTISEAGSDQLVGWLEGSDAQFMSLGPEPQRFVNVVRARDWARVPWLDAVLHSRFSLHGVGYSDRYQAGRRREEHGIESDDYLSAELLTGHALMIDRAALGRGAVRKYWLAQDFIRSIAADDIRAVEFADGDPHRVTVTWNSGARVWVNRGAPDWTVDGHVLPQFGYRAVHGAIGSAVERRGGTIVEQARGPGRFYVRSRGTGSAAPAAPAAVDFGFVRTDGALRIEARAEAIEVTPLPDSPACEVELRLADLLGRAVRVRAVEALAAPGRVRGPVPFTAERDGGAAFRTVAGDFAYRVIVE
jgi:hypothetical protein